MINMSTHDHLLVLTDKGKVYRMRGFQLPTGSRISKGIPIVNLINIDKDEKVKVLTTDDRWYGVTYKEDVEPVKASIKKLIDEGLYEEL